MQTLRRTVESIELVRTNRRSRRTRRSAGPEPRSDLRGGPLESSSTSPAASDRRTSRARRSPQRASRRGGPGRAAALLAAAAEHAPRNPKVRTLLAIVAAMRDAGRDPANFDVGLVALGAALGLPPRTTVAIFAVGRAAGWLAHAFEQRAAGFLLRPRARYVGP
ncbi:citrate/2-methylcitrate synthase [Nannocystis pusilla]|uniref:citrate/2-methylcitrate synthase n=1 Tax=Nannocystis pusilla TaxID=889268 RepID=UPI003DA42336